MFFSKKIKSPIIVLGMHRSGTSMTAGMLERVGFYLGKNLIPARADNQKGFFEHAEIVELNEKIFNNLGFTSQDVFLLPENWHQNPKINEIKEQIKTILLRDFSGHQNWCVKDPRMGKLLLFWHEVFTALKTNPAFVIIFRHPAEVAASLHLRDNISINRGLLLWAQYNCYIELFTRGKARIFLDYNQLLATPEIAFEKIQMQLNIKFEKPADELKKIARSFVDKSLKHNSAAEKNSFHIPKSFLEIYNNLLELTNDAAAPSPAIDAAMNDIQTYIEPCSETIYALNPQPGIWHGMAEKLGQK